MKLILSTLFLLSGFAKAAPRYFIQPVISEDFSASQKSEIARCVQVAQYLFTSQNRATPGPLVIEFRYKELPDIWRAGQSGIYELAITTAGAPTPARSHVEINPTVMENPVYTNWFRAVVFHEIFHALGYGTAWHDQPYIPFTAESPLTYFAWGPQDFIGPEAVAVYQIESGNAMATQIPLDSHFHLTESALWDYEIMTPTLEAETGRYLSKTSLAMMAYRPGYTLRPDFEGMYMDDLFALVPANFSLPPIVLNPQ